ncbi:MAG: response regulator [Micropepsaceae bacterium]
MLAKLTQSRPITPEKLAPSLRCTARFADEVASRASMSGSLVCIIDDDESVRTSVDSLLRSIGLQTAAFVSPIDYLAAHHATAPHCLVLDMRMPGMSGLDFQRRLKESGDEVPIVFLSGHADVPAAVSAMKAGAVEFLTKPFREQDLLDAIATALDRERVRRDEARELEALRAAYARLTDRERQVMTAVVAGRLNKQIAGALSLSKVTVKMHRGRAMRKMGAMSVADLVRMAGRLGIRAPQPAAMAAAIRPLLREA